MLFLLMYLLLFMYSLKFLLLDYTLLLEFDLVSLNSSSIMFTILLDWMSLLFMSFVFLISSMVIMYSKEYMMGDYSMVRFIMLIMMFVSSMMMLIISPNLISILLGWDGLGLMSYLLVIYYQNVKSYSAGMLTVLVNRLGDVALLLAICWMMNFGSWNFIFYLDLYKNSICMNMVLALVMLAAFTKSAQIPFSSWLPAAMAAPTPVSSLVHSSTLVTAGVYLLIRFNFSFIENFTFIALFLSSMTMFMAGLGANFEFDLKKIIALSTLSQLGLMMSILLLGGYSLAFFHLLTHALFKALLFMTGGNIIHMMSGYQDIRYMGNMLSYMPLTCVFFNISNFSLCGLPFLSGFYSKDLILESLSMTYMNMYIYFLFYISVGLTVSYSFRLFFYSMIYSNNFISVSSMSDCSFIMLKSMFGLIFLVIISGSLLSWFMFLTPSFIYLSIFMKLMTLGLILGGYYLGYELFSTKLSYSNKSLLFMGLSMFLGSMWFMPFMNTWKLNYGPLNISSSNYFLIDQGWSEYYGVKNLYMKMKNVSLFMNFIWSNTLNYYFMILMCWFILLMFMY
uniref:NADH-ubiquinone oxidoreductase chain 5 n=1 Tax=Scydosella musawasensis TaxID=1819563 RepID=A0A165CYP3_9COLE|nr:NADH dehydrogenase subunit 5 [Scydosella musawasensis]